MEGGGSGTVASSIVGSTTFEKKERTFASLNEVLEQGSISDLKKYVKVQRPMLVNVIVVFTFL